MSSDIKDFYDLTSVSTLTLGSLGTLVLLFGYQIITSPGLPKIPLVVIIIGSLWMVTYVFAVKIFRKNCIKIRSTLRKNFQISLTISKEDFQRQLPKTIRDYGRRYLKEHIAVVILITIAIYLLVVAGGHLTTVAIIILLGIGLFFYRNYTDNPVSAHYQGQIDPRVSATGQKDIS